VALFDAHFALCLVQPVLPDESPNIAPHLRASLLHGRQLLMSDLHLRSDQQPAPGLGLPGFPGGAAANTKLPPVGYIYLRAEAAHGLNQILREWAVPSRTAETCWSAAKATRCPS